MQGRAGRTQFDDCEDIQALLTLIELGFGVSSQIGDSAESRHDVRESATSRRKVRMIDDVGWLLGARRLLGMRAVRRRYCLFPSFLHRLCMKSDHIAKHLRYLHSCARYGVAIAMWEESAPGRF